MALSNLHVSVWRRPAAVEDVVALGDELARLAEQRHRIGILVVVPAGIPVSPDAARRRAVALLRELSGSVIAIALVIEGVGFGPAAVRSMFTGLAMLLRHPWSWKMFADAGRAAGWMAGQLGPGVGGEVGVEAIDTAIDTARQRVRRLADDA